MENIGLCKKNGDVAVCVGGSVVLEGNSRAVKLYSPLVCKNLRRNCSGGRGREGKVPALNSRRSTWIRRILCPELCRKADLTRISTLF